MIHNEMTVTNKWILGEGKNGTFSNLKILVGKGDKSNLERGKEIENTNEELLTEIERQLSENWIVGYEKDGINLQITILNVGIDSQGRKYAIENSVNGAMHMALPKIGVVPPQIFSL